jgi:excisionase family DNA binding protein
MIASPESNLLDGYPVVLNLHQVAEILQRSEDRTRLWLREGHIHAIRVGGSWRVARVVLERHLLGEGGK